MSKTGPQYSSKPPPAKAFFQDMHESDFCYATGCFYFQKTSSSARAGYYFADGSLSKPLAD